MPEGLPTNSNEHLIKGVNPIMVCVGVSNGLEENLNDLLKKNNEENISVENINFYADKSDLDKQNFLNRGRKTYVISIFDGLDKFSSGYRNCTGLVVMGIDKETGENFSILSHQTSRELLTGKSNIFSEHLEERLNEIKSRCKLGTIDAVILGGNYRPDFSFLKYRLRDSFTEDYVKSINLLSMEVKKCLGFDPVVVNGPKNIDEERGSSDAVYVYTKERRVNLLRSNVNNNISDFSGGDVDSQSKKWK